MQPRLADTDTGIGTTTGTDACATALHNYLHTEC